MPTNRPTEAEVRGLMKYFTPPADRIHGTLSPDVRQCVLAVCEDWQRLRKSLEDISLLHPIQGARAATILAQAALLDGQRRNTDEEPPHA